MYCPSCGTELSDPQQFCPKCGASLVAVPPPPKTKRPGPSGRSKFLWLIASLFVVLVAVSVTSSLHESSGQDSTIRYIARDTYGVVKVEDFGFVWDAAQSGDAEAMNAVLRDGRAYRVAHGTRVTAVSESVLPGVTTVIVETGPLIGKALYIPTSELRKFNPWGK
jgi:hypothetical protein